MRMVRVEAQSLLVLPTLNEELALRALVDEIPSGFDVLVVDSGSCDGTVEVAYEAGFKVVYARYGRGQGSGIRTGFEYFLDNDYGFLLFIDCDYTDNPRDLNGMLSGLEAGDYDVLLGIRDFIKQRMILGAPTILVKKTASACIHILMEWDIRDVTTGFWGFNAGAVKALTPRLRENDFPWGFELLYHCWLLGLRVGEVDVDFRKRIGESKFHLGKRLIYFIKGVEYGLFTIFKRFYPV